MSELIGLIAELFAGAAPRHDEYGKTLLASILAIVLITALVAITFSSLLLFGK